MNSKFEQQFLKLLESEHQKAIQKEEAAAELDRVIGVQPWSVETPVCETMLPQTDLPKWFT